ncbi:LacI family transcriptional regulator [Paenibacillus thiaminolyticus]|uniref:LacI family transcriptional regulator n=1 Tax=Paenibacillus thiaminolyticus TaxID=49283 RepID=A0AAP9DTJ3_PANTH|nr:LacI family DNA-binding transcriptional regulator [Paenibacillus thiaminolyticus]MCY9537462.1 LacI family transcriptional regulator [Paenibacillus thiaminolyticus]MCY9601149.1 LacI family transcriptional regulator [Paenibacillus thiaminolyticus]MCY9607471.1 LacI family transcriptional regulator [Paenibacillus thiaminolyticus]MCY9613132.1 LacI family transcriptional regulator [Paenibacillus thiaminolyticus]MCY9617547.1 LacI family transcriptional regulator [Paenibacillus thiaminolyticus]
MVSIKDVARYANVSVTVVSKTLNGYSDVSEETKKKVMKAVEELNYSPNMVAKNLKQKVTKSIALIFSNFERSSGKDGVIFQIMSGIYEAAMNYKYEVVIYTRSLSEQQDKSYWQFCKEHKLSGAIITGLKTTDPYFLEIVDSNFPCVVIDADIVGEYTGSIMTDNVKAARHAVQHLIDSGHRRIGMINGHDFAVVSKQRHEGYGLALEANGIPYDPALVVHADYSESIAYDIADRYVKDNPEMTAVFCASDLMAIGFMKRCRELGIRIPEDLSVIGFDDIVLSDYTTPRLTTIRQNFKGSAMAAFDHAVQIIEHKEQGKHITISFERIDRESVRML